MAVPVETGGDTGGGHERLVLLFPTFQTFTRSLLVCTNYASAGKGNLASFVIPKNRDDMHVNKGAHGSTMRRRLEERHRRSRASVLVRMTKCVERRAGRAVDGVLGEPRVIG